MLLDLALILILGSSFHSVHDSWCILTVLAPHLSVRKFLLLFKDFDLIAFVYVCFICMDVCALCGCSTSRGQKRASVPLGLELTVVCDPLEEQPML